MDESKNRQSPTSTHKPLTNLTRFMEELKPFQWPKGRCQVKSQLKAVKSVMIAARGNSFGSLAMSNRSDMYYVLVFISFVTAFWRWKRKMVALAFGEDQGGSSAPRPIGLFFPIASVGGDDFLILDVTPLKDEAVVMKKYGASNSVSFAGPIESDTYRNTLIDHLLMELGC
ncbi:hypothetical protein Tco_1283752 [Tanacetum coccineum]